jgi:hypothetical protein
MFTPGLGFYGNGLIHLLGNLSRTATANLRQLIDAGTLSNMPAGFKARGLRIEMMTSHYNLESGEMSMLLERSYAARSYLCPTKSRARLCSSCLVL